MSGHTPRPWYLDEMTGCICGPDGKPIQVCSKQAYRYGEGTAEAFANNQLFFAAPDLLKAAKIALDQLLRLNAHFYRDGEWNEISSLKAAIAKAEERA